MTKGSGNGQLVPYLQDAIEKKIDVSCKKKAIIYLTSLNVFDPDVEASLLFLIKNFNAKAYEELYSYTNNLISKK